MSRSHLCTVLVALLLFTGSVSAMIRTLTLADLVKQSELIVLAKVEKVGEINRDAKGLSTVKNVLLTEKVLKGTWDQREPLVVMTLQGAPGGVTGALEDQVEFPPKGFQVVVFLKKNTSGGWETVNLVQGIWPVKEKKFLGMGLGTTMEQLEKAVKNP